MSLQATHLKDACLSQMGDWWHHRNKGRNGLKEYKRARAMEEPICKFYNYWTLPRQLHVVA